MLCRQGLNPTSPPRASCMGSLASPAGDMWCPARGEVPPISRGKWPRSSRPSAVRGAVRRAVPGGQERDGVRVGLLAPKAAGDSSSWTPELCAAVWPAATSGFRVIPAAHNSPAASSKATAMQAPPRLIVHQNTPPFEKMAETFCNASFHSILVVSTPCKKICDTLSLILFDYVGSSFFSWGSQTREVEPL